MTCSSTQPSWAYAKRTLEEPPQKAEVGAERFAVVESLMAEIYTVWPAEELNTRRKSALQRIS